MYLKRGRRRSAVRRRHRSKRTRRPTNPSVSLGGYTAHHCDIVSIIFFYPGAGGWRPFPEWGDGEFERFPSWQGAVPGHKRPLSNPTAAPPIISPFMLVYVRVWSDSVDIGQKKGLPSDPQLKKHSQDTPPNYQSIYYNL